MASEILGWITGFALLTVTAAYIIITVSPQIGSLSENSAIELAKIQMSMLDYSASKSSLGESPSQKVKLNLFGGTLTVDSDGNWLEIIAVRPNDSEIIYNDTIGRVIYTKGSTVIGYEGGGIWTENTVLSPPEFHYVGNTLTLPIIKIVNNYSVSGYTVEFPIIYEGATIHYPNETRNFINPVIEAYYIEIKLKSDFYKAWAKYFDIYKYEYNVDHDNKTITVSLPADWSNLKISLSNLDKGILIGKLNESNKTPFSSLIIHFEDLSSDLNLPLYTDTERYELCISFKKTGGGNNVDYLVVAFIDHDNNTYESWISTRSIPWSNNNQDIDLLNSSITMKYTDKLQGVNVHVIQGKSFLNPTVTWGNDIDAVDAGDFSEGKNLTLNEIIQHYFYVLAKKTEGIIVLKKPAGSQYKGYDEKNSWIYFDADTAGGILFLYVHDHRIRLGSSY